MNIITSEKKTNQYNTYQKIFWKKSENFPIILKCWNDRRENKETNTVNFLEKKDQVALKLWLWVSE